MSKPILGMILGAILGLLDGLGAYAYPAARPAIAGIVIGSTGKGILTGLAAGFFATRLKSLPLGILAGLAVGFVLSWFVAANSPLEGKYYYWEIMLPGSAVGAIVGYATWKFGRAARPQTQ
jgi:hypothetical protein